MSSATSTQSLNSIPTTRRVPEIWAWILEHRLVVLAFAVLVLAAASVRLLTFERYLPYFDYSDETPPYLVARNMRGLFDDWFVEWRYAGYPPAYPLVSIGVQMVVEAFAIHPWTVPPDYFYALRLLAAWVGVITVLVVASSAWQLAGPIAAWFAGLIWALAPIIVEHNSLATADPFVYLTCGLAITTALRAWRTESPIWLSASLIVSVLAIYFKLWPIHALIPWGVVTLLLLRRNPRQWLPWLLAWAAFGLASAAYLFLRIRPLDIPAREIDTFNSEGLTMMLTPSRNVTNWQFAIYPIGLLLFFAVIILAAGAYVYSRGRGWRILNWRQIGLLLLYSAAGILMASSFTQVRLEGGKIRHVLPVSVALFALWGAGLAQITWTLKSWAQSHKLPSRQQMLAPAVVFGLVSLWILPGFISGNLELVQRFSLTDIRAVLWRWADVNVPMEGRILIHPSSVLAFTWNREWSGYDGSKPFEYWLEVSDEIAANTPERYVERGIAYYVTSEADRGKTFDTPGLQAFVEQLTLVKTLPARPDILGETVYFYRMLPPQVSTTITFGDQIALVGYDLNSTEFDPGEAVQFRPYWHEQRRPDSNYSMFVHLYPGDEEQLIIQFDGSPASAQRPTLTWDDTEELYIGSDAALLLPTDIEPGSYRLAVGLYDFNTGQRLATDDGHTYFTIPITINPA
jgi:hypothetical protein